jgi:alkanesulfonate monooxygenase SsuD/methylene tetrahydromethanopterin reductase-like flavin-dependent oxidoreductase (luciferase family)
MPKPEFNGKWIKFKGVNAMPRPVQQPHPEIVFGGHTKEAFSRAARLAKGWYGFALDLDGTAKCVEGVRAACKETGRKFEDVEISITPSPRMKVDRDTAKRYADLGVSRLILLPRGSNGASLVPRGADEASVLEAVREIERDLIGKI